MSAGVTAIPLGRRLPGASSNLPGRPDPDTDPEAHSRELRAVPIRSCSRWGLPCRRRCRRRGALLPHRFTLAAVNATHRGGLFSVALSLGSHPPDVIRHRLSTEPGLSSPITPSLPRWRGREGWGLPERPSDRLTRTGMGSLPAVVKGRPAASQSGRGRPCCGDGYDRRANPAACCASTHRQCRRRVRDENAAGKRLRPRASSSRIRR